MFENLLKRSRTKVLNHFPNRNPIPLDEHFDGLYSIVLSNNMSDLSKLLQQKKGNVYYGIPVGVGTIDINMMRPDSFDMIFRYKNMDGEIQENHEKDSYGNLSYRLNTIPIINSNIEIPNDFSHDIEKHLSSFYDTFVDLLDTPDKNGNLPYGKWSFFYGKVMFSFERGVEVNSHYKRAYSRGYIRLLKQNDYGYGGSGEGEQIFCADKKFDTIRRWKQYLDKYLVP